ncbi:MAG: hypothetical protein IGS39_04785 [Calothrix sp. C42_A2020_038]|nr:hypothetical protein [Calothrix sp. C42_A2020_038]
MLVNSIAFSILAAFNNPPAFCAILKSMMSKEFSPCIHSILTSLKLPSLLLWGQQDRMILSSLARSFFELLTWIDNQVLVPAT